MSRETDEIRILAVDDEVRGVELLQRALRRIGGVDGASSGQEAWEMLQATRYDLVLSDQRMPGMKGVDLLTASRDELGKFCPFAVLDPTSSSWMIFGQQRTILLSVDAWDKEGWWANVRKSNTEPMLRLNLEARDEQTRQKMLDEVTPLLGQPAKGH